MDRTWMPTTAGIINIVLGALALVAALACLFAGIAGTAILNFYHLDLPASIVGFVLITIGVFCAIIGALAIAGGYYALKRRAWGLALTGSILCIAVFWIGAVASIVFVILGRKEFR